MTTDSFLTAIEGAAEDTIAQIHAETDAKVADILGEARKGADERTGRYLRENEMEANRNALREINAAQVKAQQAVSNASYEMYEDFFHGIGNDLSGYRADTKKYEPVFRSLLDDAIGDFEGGVVSVDPRDKELVRSVLKGRDGFTLETDISTAGGCVVSNSGKTIVRDNTFETRLNRVREDMASQIWSVLRS